MTNPFVVFDHRLFGALRKAGHAFFVRQTYARGLDHFDTEVKGSFLISHYNNINQAQIHFQALEKDASRFLFDITVPDHLARLEAASKGFPGYKVFSPILPGPWKPGEQTAAKIRNYISQELNWKPGRSDQVKSDLFVQFGELFLTLQFRSHKIKIPFSDIERR